MRCAVVDLARDPASLAFAATDGFGGAFVDADWWKSVANELVGHADRVDRAELARRLPGWVAGPAAVGGDDASLVLMLSTAADAVRNDQPVS
jgi:hypothetical protein